MCMYFQEPYFTNIDFKANSEFAPTVTDSGLCHVLNGPPIGAVFAKSERVGQLEGRNIIDILGTSSNLSLIMFEVYRHIKNSCSLVLKLSLKLSLTCP